jgi:osmotically-inducible protein OsmY
MNIVPWIRSGAGIALLSVSGCVSGDAGIPTSGARLVAEDVRARLSADTVASACMVSIQVSPDGVATLRGFVPDSTSAARVESVVRHTAGVSAVRNELTVRP